MTKRCSSCRGLLGPVDETGFARCESCGKNQQVGKARRHVQPPTPAPRTRPRPTEIWPQGLEPLPPVPELEWPEPPPPIEPPPPLPDLPVTEPLPDVMRTDVPLPVPPVSVPPLPEPPVPIPPVPVPPVPELPLPEPLPPVPAVHHSLDLPAAPEPQPVPPPVDAPVSQEEPEALSAFDWDAPDPDGPDPDAAEPASAFDWDAAEPDEQPAPEPEPPALPAPKPDLYSYKGPKPLAGWEVEAHQHGPASSGAWTTRPDPPAADTGPPGWAVSGRPAPEPTMSPRAMRATIPPRPTFHPPPRVRSGPDPKVVIRLLIFVFIVVVVMVAVSNARKEDRESGSAVPSATVPSALGANADRFVGPIALVRDQSGIAAVVGVHRPNGDGAISSFGLRVAEGEADASATIDNLDADPVAVVAAADTLYVLTEDHLYVYAATDGTPLWDAEVIGVPDRCIRCMVAVDGVAIVQFEDGNLAAYGPGAPGARWTRPNRTSLAVAPTGRLVAVAETSTRPGAGLDVAFVRPDEGAAVATAQLSCPGPESARPDELAGEAEIAPIPDSTDVLVAWGDPQTCLARVADTGQVRWQSTSEEVLHLGGAVVTSTAAVLVDTPGPVIVSLADGSLRSGQNEPGRGLFMPRGVVGQSVVGESWYHDRDGVVRVRLTAFALDSGQELWTRELPDPAGLLGRGDGLDPASPGRSWAGVSGSTLDGSGTWEDLQVVTMSASGSMVVTQLDPTSGQPERVVGTASIALPAGEDGSGALPVLVPFGDGVAIVHGRGIVIVTTEGPPIELGES